MSARSLDVGGAVDPSSAADRAIDRRRILGAIAEDKARHAELSYRIVRWLLDGFDVRRVVTESFAAARTSTSLNRAAPSSRRRYRPRTRACRR